MLIPSPRHRACDLKLWSELEGADHVHGLRLMKSAKLQQSLDALRSFAARGPCYVSYSGGKDSTALLGLVALAGLSIPVVWFRAVPKCNPDVPEVIAAVERQLGISVEVVDYVSPVPVRLTRLEADEIACGNFLAACRVHERSHGRRVIGVRGDESRARILKMRRWGLASPNSCTPLGWWTAADVFGFLAVQGLPVHPTYAMLGGGRWNRHRLRVDALMGERGDAFGSVQWESEYYGDVLRRLEVGGGRP